MREPVVALRRAAVVRPVVVLMVRDREVEVRDRDLVNRILDAAGGN